MLETLKETLTWAAWLLTWILLVIGSMTWFWRRFSGDTRVPITLVAALIPGPVVQFLPQLIAGILGDEELPVPSTPADAAGIGVDIVLAVLVIGVIAWCLRSGAREDRPAVQPARPLPTEPAQVEPAQVEPEPAEPADVQTPDPTAWPTWPPHSWPTRPVTGRGPR